MNGQTFVFPLADGSECTKEFLTDASKMKALAQIADRLPNFQCHKQVHAIPMTLGDYNDIRGWSIPDDEDPKAEGVFVIYDIGTDDEYVSWSPIKQFEKGYRDCTTFVDRLRIELADLEKKVTALELFMNTSVFAALEIVDQALLRSQFGSMTSYAYTLTMRIDRATRKAEHEHFRKVK